MKKVTMHSSDIILPIAFSLGGLLAAYIDGKWNCTFWVAMGYFGMFVLGAQQGHKQ